MPENPKAVKTGCELLLSAFWAAVLLTTIFIRVRLLSVPLERDEGEYAYFAQLLLKGIPPYVSAYSMKLPGACGAYAAIMAILGQSTEAIHVGLLLVDLFSAALLFRIAKRFYGSTAALASAACFSFMAVGPPFQGSAAHATHFVVMFILASILFGIDSSKASFLRIYLSGFSAGMAFLMKQHAAVLVLFVLWLIILESCRNESAATRRFAFFRALSFGIGVVTPYAAVCYIAFEKGFFGKFWFWTFSYARQYASETTLREGIENFSNQTIAVVKPYLLLWLAAAGGFWLCLRSRTLPSSRFVIYLGASSFAAICPGMYFRGHYYVLLLPATALAIGAAHAFGEIGASSSRFQALRVFAAILAIVFTFSQFSGYFFSWSPTEVSRNLYGTNPFVESAAIADFVRARTHENEKIMVLGSEPQIYFYSNRIAASGHIYMYGLMESQPYSSRMQNELIADVEAVRPNIIIVVRNPLSWCVENNSDATLLKWVGTYVGGNYDKIGLVNIGYPDEPLSETHLNTPRNVTDYILVFKRKVGTAPGPGDSLPP